MQEYVQSTHQLRQVLETMATRYKDQVALWAMHRLCDRYPERDDFSDNYWDFRPDDGQWTFMPGTRIKTIREEYAAQGNWALTTDLFFSPDQISLRVRTKPTRGLMKLVDIFRHTDDGLDVSDADLSRFSDNWRAVMEPMDVDIVAGEELRRAYQGIDGSCMSYESCQEYLDVYVETPGIRLAIVRNDGGEEVCRGHYGCGPAQGRALVWEFDEDLTFMDRQYGDYTVKNALRDYGIRQGWLVKNHDNDTWHLPNGELVSTLPREFRDKMRMKLKRDDFDYMPYADTMRYWCRGCDTLARTHTYDSCKECGWHLVALDGTSGDDHSGWYADPVCERCGYRDCECTWCPICREDYYDDGDGCPNTERCNVCGETTHMQEPCDHCNAEWCDNCREWYADDPDDDEGPDGCPNCQRCDSCRLSFRRSQIVDGQCQRCAVSVSCGHCHTRVRPFEQVFPATASDHMLQEITDDIPCTRCGRPLDPGECHRVWRVQLRRSQEMARDAGWSVTYHPAPVSAWDFGGFLARHHVCASNESIHDYRIRSPRITVAGGAFSDLDRIVHFRATENLLRDRMDEVADEVRNEGVASGLEGDDLTTHVMLSDRVLEAMRQLSDAQMMHNRYINVHMPDFRYDGQNHRERHRWLF